MSDELTATVANRYISPAIRNGGGANMWGVDWMWGVPMLLASVAFQVVGLVVITGLLRWSRARRVKPRSMLNFLWMALLVANAILLLHIAEAIAWAWLYVKLEAIDSFPDAMLFSFNAITSYGHNDSQLADKWKLLGAIEAMTGVMIFGLSTAFFSAPLNACGRTKTRLHRWGLVGPVHGVRNEDEAGAPTVRR